jgi:hypothetical protein
MSLTLAIWLVRACGVYLGLGLLFGLVFVTALVGRIDPGAREAGKGFRLLILPGAVLLWPLLLLRVARGQSQPPTECSPHRRAARGAGGSS